MPNKRTSVEGVPNGICAFFRTGTIWTEILRPYGQALRIDAYGGPASPSDSSVAITIRADSYALPQAATPGANDYYEVLRMQRMYPEVGTADVYRVFDRGS